MFDWSVTSVGQPTISGLSCHILDIFGMRLLLECPLNVSSSLHFLPAVVAPGASNGQLGWSHLDDHQDTGKQTRDSDDQALGGTSWSSEEKLLPPFKRIHGQVLIDAEPFYKLADIGTLDWSSLDAVLISNPHAMLGLPYLMQEPSFSAKVYVTEAAGKLGQLCMEELVAMHESYIAEFGVSYTGGQPSWLEARAQGTLPPGLKGLLGNKRWDSCNWRRMYNGGDLKLCMKRLHCLRYGEVASIEGCVEVKPVSSGLGLGAANWSIVGARTKLAYISGSLLVENHSSSFDSSSLLGSDYLLFSEVEPKSEQETCSEIVDGVQLESKALGHGTRNVRANSSAVKKSTSLTSRVGKVSPASSLRHVPSTGSVPLKSRSCESVSPPVRTVKHPIHGSSEIGGTQVQEFPVSEWKSSLTAICKAAIDAATLGGSVLIPVSPSGAVVELIEELAVLLAATGAPTVPIFYISPAAGELLSYTNTIPEWLSSSRKEKLYAGEALFGHVDLLQDKRLQHFPSLSSPELQRSWQEPCIVFASHWNMRMGPAVHLLHRWFQNPQCLLIAVEPNVDLLLALAPHLPMAMKAIHLPMPSSLRPHDVASVIRSVHSNFVLVPGVVRESLETIMGTATKNIQYYETGATVHLTNHQEQLIVDMSSSLAGHGLAKELKAGRSSAIQVRGELTFKDEKWHLDSLPSSQSKHQCRWGALNLEKLLSGLKERGLHCIYMKDEVTLGLDGIRKSSRANTIVKRSVVEVISPCEGRIEISSEGTTIRVNDPVARMLITQAVTAHYENCATLGHEYGVHDLRAVNLQNMFRLSQARDAGATVSWFANRIEADASSRIRFNACVLLSFSKASTILVVPRQKEAMAVVTEFQVPRMQWEGASARGGSETGTHHQDTPAPDLSRRRSSRKRCLDFHESRGADCQTSSASLPEDTQKRAKLRGERIRRVLDDDFLKNLGEWRSLGVNAEELRLDLTLPTGQSFRWKKTGDDQYTGVIGSLLVSLRQGDQDVFFLIHPPGLKHDAACMAKPEVSNRDTAARQAVPRDDSDAEAKLRDYLNLDTCLKDLWTLFKEADKRFAAVAPYMAGARLLRQDPLECVFQFICSSNNHIQRISSMVDHLASLGPYLGTVNGIHFHQFPGLDQLACVKEMALRDAGFGYRAKFIVGAAEALRFRDGAEGWLFSLRKMQLEDAISALCTLPGVGPKVAACIALFSLDQHHAIPVDTHVWQIAVRHLIPELAGERLTPKLHVEIADAFVKRFGKYAGWAHTVLFIAELSSQQSLLPEHLRSSKGVRVKRKSRAKASGSS